MIDRRMFLQQAGLLAASTVSFPLPQPQPTRRIGLQLFTLNGPMNRDPVGTLKRVAAMGYEEVETYGINPGALTYYGMPARDFASLLRDLGLTTPSGHYDIQDFLDASNDEMDRYVDRSVGLLGTAGRP